MEDYHNVEFSLGDLAQIALGTEELNGVNVAVLHSLLDLIMKKLNCQNDKVTVSGYECKFVQAMLSISTISPLPFNDENMHIPFGEFQKLDAIEQILNEVDDELKQHLESLQGPDSPRAARYSEYGFHSCEDLCTACDPDNEITCQLIQSIDFVRQLMVKVAAPLVERIFAMDKKLKKFQRSLTNMLKQASDGYSRIVLVDKLVADVGALYEMFDENQAKFMATMRELQEVLDLKIDRYHVPVLKANIHEKISEFKDALKQLDGVINCNRAAGIVWDDISAKPFEPVKTAPPPQPGCTRKFECIAKSKEIPLVDRIAALNIENIASMVEGKGLRKSIGNEGVPRVMLNVESQTFLAAAESKARRHLEDDDVDDEDDDD